MDQNIVFLKGLHCIIWFFIIEEYAYSKTCLKRPIKNRQDEDLNDKW